MNPGHDLLLKLAKGLREYVQDEWFNIANWTTNSNGGKDSTGEFIERRCGTAACAMGWAPFLLKDCLPSHITFENCRLGVFIYIDKHRNVEKFDGFNIAVDLFQIKYTDSIYLFDALFYPNRNKTTRLEVAERIEKFVEQKNVISN